MHRPKFGIADHLLVKNSVDSNSASFMLCAKLLVGSAGEKAVTF
jgi:hypothetical protein